jgi:hypothetical protein
MNTAEAMGHVALLTTVGICPLLFGTIGFVVGLALLIAWILYLMPRPK